LADVITASLQFADAVTIDAIARRYYDYFNDRLFDDAGQLVHPEAIFYYVPTKQRLVGRAGYRALVAAWLIAFDDASLEIVSLEQVDEHTIRTQFIGRGTHTGDLVLGETFLLPASGVSAELEFSDTLTFRNGWIVEGRLEFDAGELRRRLTASAVSKA